MRACLSFVLALLVCLTASTYSFPPSPPLSPALQPMTPRQLRLVAGPASVCNQGGETMLREEDAPYMFDSKDARKAQTDRLRRYVSLLKEEGLTGTTSYTPAWQGKIARAAPSRGEHDNSTIIDSSFAEGESWRLLQSACSSQPSPVWSPAVCSEICAMALMGGPACFVCMYSKLITFSAPFSPCLCADAELIEIRQQLESKYRTNA